jgi:hypothetical protein
MHRFVLEDNGCYFVMHRFVLCEMGGLHWLNFIWESRGSQFYGGW